ncbi:MAG: hypothetical protein NTV68_13820 [Methanomicrobiales archaeon]|nr:hypothetical protein [Methanomicrobiales archaeon]
MTTNVIHYTEQAIERIGEPDSNDLCPATGSRRPGDYVTNGRHER